MIQKIKIQHESNDVFSDIKINMPERIRARAEVMLKINEIIKKRGLKQKQIAETLNISQPKVSCLLNGKINLFSLDNLFEMLNRLGNDVEIVIRPKRSRLKYASTNVLSRPAFA